MSFIPWSKTELSARVKEFPKPKEKPQKFFEELRVIIRTYDPGLPDIYHLIYMLVGPGEAQKLM